MAELIAVVRRRWKKTSGAVYGYTSGVSFVGRGCGLTRGSLM